jgi:formamidopyrimidine-DNA glycosylase
VPELPEVELYTRYFARHALQQRIAKVRVLDERILGAVRKDAFARMLRGHTFTRVRRHGKHLFADAGGVWLHLHFGMTGDLSYSRSRRPGGRPGGVPPPRFARVIFDFDNGASLAFEDMRLFGVVDTTPDPEAFIEQHALGPDPLTLRLPAFRRLLATRRGAVKSTLMSQDVIAGIGNLYADETLFQTSIAPRRPVDRLSPSEIATIFTTMRKILLTVIDLKEHDRDYPPRYLIHHREEGAHCPRCGGTIAKSVVFGRTTYSCARHQT